MAETSPIKYAESRRGFVAYRSAGTGPDILLINDWFSHAAELWRLDSPFLPVLDRLSSFSHLITFDKRGVGMSDPLPSAYLPTLEEWADDVVAVLDAEHIEEASIVGKGSGGTMAMLFAATYPDRVKSLVLINAWARLSEAPDFPIGVSEAGQATMLRAPYMPTDSVHAVAGRRLSQAVLEWYQGYVRTAVSPGTVTTMRRWQFSLDVRDVLSSITCPTRVISYVDAWIGAAQGRYLADHIATAELVELPGATDLLFAGDVELMASEIEEMVTGQRPSVTTDREVATLLYTDLVDSTSMAARLGDRRWHDLLDRHDQAVRHALEATGGIEVKTTGDGFLARFASPSRAILGARAIRDAVRRLGLECRAGLHAGEVEIRGNEVGGIAVHLTARVMDLGGADDILASRTVRDLVAGSGFRFADHGLHQLKGIEDDWQIYAVVD